MTTQVDLLVRASALMDGTFVVGGVDPARAAAWFARAALEGRVIDVLRNHGVDSTRATMRTRLSCLRVLAPDVADQAEVAWAGLSRACHHHAFELTPTAAEVEELITATRLVTSTEAHTTAAAGSCLPLAVPPE